MQLKFSIPFYKEAPFVRLLFALVLGILLQWYLPVSLTIIIVSLVCLAVAFTTSLFFKKKIAFFVYAKSILLQCIILVIGMLLIFVHNIKNNANYFTKKINSPTYKTILTLTEPISEKTKTYKANASILSIVNGDTINKATGGVLVYFKKDSLPNTLQYGNTIIINKVLQPIQNNGNPGAFDYAQQSLFKGITHQVFLEKNDYLLLSEKHTTVLSRFLFTIREKVLAILDKNIVPIKEKGLAEALLIGYRDDLDKDLNQAYSNTGTVHVIAISGLHLGFIYLLLVYLFKPFEKRKYGKQISKWLKPIVIITVLWIFSLLAGGAPSILRSAIMFTCIVIGDSLQRKTSIYNTLAISAFIILCFYPFSLWDVGFQLSYSAVLSIVLFMQPIYRLFYFKNKALDWFWKLNAVTLSAQILTIPITIYHFHKFPNLFLFTNIVAVPLSTIILAGELLLLIFSWWNPVALFIGKVVQWLIWAMNSYIEWWNGFSFSLTDFLQINMLQCILLYVIIALFGYWLLQKKKNAFIIALGFVAIFLGLNIWYKWNITNQQKLIVYNVPKQQAIDFVNGNTYQFVGDSTLLEDGIAKNFHLKPTRINWQIKPAKTFSIPNQHPLYSFNNKNILVIDAAYNYENTNNFKNIDVAILSKNPKLYIDSLANTFTLKQVVADATNPSWKVKLWQKDCERLKIPFHNTNEQGAFVFNF
jgi:competence protein ComEC